MVESIKVSKKLSSALPGNSITVKGSQKKKPEKDAENVSDVSKIYLLEFEYFGSDLPTKTSDYSPRSTQNIFKNSLPILAVTPVKNFY